MNLLKSTRLALATSTVLCIGTVSVFLFSFTSTPENFPDMGRSFKNGDSLSFDFNLPDSLYEGMSSMGSYDGKKYKVQYNSKGEIKVSNLQGARGISQNNLDLFLACGTLKQNEDNLSISASTHFNTFYLYSLEKGLLDSFSSTIEINLRSKTLKNKWCPHWVTTNGRLSITALPNGIHYKKTYRYSHAPKTVGIFENFSIQDANGTLKNYAQGDYILVGGNSQEIKI